MENKKQRKLIIMQSLAGMLEERELMKITTAELAKRSEITEAAIYCLLYTSPSPRDLVISRMPSSA